MREESRSLPPFIRSLVARLITFGKPMLSSVSWVGSFCVVLLLVLLTRSSIVSSNLYGESKLVNDAGIRMILSQWESWTFFPFLYSKIIKDDPRLYLKIVKDFLLRFHRCLHLPSSRLNLLFSLSHIWNVVTHTTLNIYVASTAVTQWTISMNKNVETAALGSHHLWGHKHCIWQTGIIVKMEILAITCCVYSHLEDFHGWNDLQKWGSDHLALACEFSFVPSTDSGRRKAEGESG